MAGALFLHKTPGTIQTREQQKRQKIAAGFDPVSFWFFEYRKAFSVPFAFAQKLAGNNNYK
jgi:hypothetical protein